MSPNFHASHVYNDGNTLSECHMFVVKITSTNTRKPCSPLPGLVWLYGCILRSFTESVCGKAKQSQVPWQCSAFSIPAAARWWCSYTLKWGTKTWNWATLATQPILSVTCVSWYLLRIIFLCGRNLFLRNGLLCMGLKFLEREELWLRSYHILWHRVAAAVQGKVETICRFSKNCQLLLILPFTHIIAFFAKNIF